MLRYNARNSGPAIAAGLSMLVIATIAVASENNGPAKVEEIQGSDLKRVILTPTAAERLAIQTVPVREEKVRRWVMLVAKVEEEPALGSDPTSAVRPPGSNGDLIVRVLLDTNPADDEDDFGEVDDEDDAEIVVPMHDEDDDDESDVPLRAKRVVRYPLLQAPDEGAWPSPGPASRC